MTKKPNPYLIDDDAPELTAEDFAKAMPFYEAFPELRPRGRPKSPAPKVAVSLRLDPAVLEAYKALGPGWQSQINAVLRKHYPGAAREDEKSDRRSA